MKHLVLTLLLAAAAPAFAQDPCAQKNSAACVKATQDRCRAAANADLEKVRALPAKDSASIEIRDTLTRKVENLINESRSGRVDVTCPNAATEQTTKISALIPGLASW